MACMITEKETAKEPLITYCGMHVQKLYMYHEKKNMVKKLLVKG